MSGSSNLCASSIHPLHTTDELHAEVGRLVFLVWRSRLHVSASGALLCPLLLLTSSCVSVDLRAPRWRRRCFSHRDVQEDEFSSEDIDDDDDADADGESGDDDSGDDADEADDDDMVIMVRKRTSYSWP